MYETGISPVSGAGVQNHELLTTVERLEEIVDAETVALAEHRVMDLAVYTRKKSQLLLEVTRLTRMMKLPSADSQLHGRLQSLRSSLDLNRNTLDLHLRAANQLTEVISDAVRAAESDGTYSESDYGDRFV